MNHWLYPFLVTPLVAYTYGNAALYTIVSVCVTRDYQNGPSVF